MKISQNSLEGCSRKWLLEKEGKQIIDELLGNSIIWERRSSFCSPILSAKKKIDQVRLSVDFRVLGKKIRENLIENFQIILVVWVQKN